MKIAIAMAMVCGVTPWLVHTAGATASAGASAGAHARRLAAEDILSRSLAVYASLKSYADTGVVVNQFAANSSYRHTFTTYYRAPRHFYFDFAADKAAGAAHTVMWCDGGDFQSWSSAIAQHDTYPRGSNTVISGFTAAASPTQRTITLIPGVLFAGSGLLSTLNELADYTVEGIDEVGGHRCHKLVGVARSVYRQTQRVTNVRRAIVWIDAESLLVRKVFEDTPQGLPLTAVSRITVTLEPQANPTLEDARFRYAVPSLQK